MPRTETCTACEGTGDINDYTPGGAGQHPCDACGGNGYVPAAEPTIHDAIQSLRDAEPHDLYKTGDTDAPESIKDRNGDVALGLCRKCGKAEAELDGPCDADDIYAKAAKAVSAQTVDIDLTNTKPVPGRMANQTWRILEEQRMAAEETIAECEAEIERWTAKMVDAVKAKRICEAGQAALEGPD